MPERPNFLLFMPETVRADAVQGPTDGRAQTPNMDTLATEGVTFTQCFCQAPYCSPSRCSMFTGRYPHTDGHRSLFHLLHDHERNFFRDLKDAGYTNVAYGKNDLLAQDAIDLCFDETQPRVKAEPGSSKTNPYPEDHRLHRSFYYGCREGTDMHDGDWACVQSALQFLDEDRAEPFCIYLPLSFAHPPYQVEEPFFSLHERDALPPPIPAETTERRSFHAVRRETFGMPGLTEADFREVKACYYGMVSRVDHQLGLLVDKLKERGLYEDTVIVVFSDHGDYAGDYGLIEKFLAGFEDCLLQVPLILRAPGLPTGLTRSPLCEMTDLYPTLMDLAGLTPSHYHFGKSLLPLWRGEAQTHRDAVFAEGGFHLDEAEPFIAKVAPTSPYYEAIERHRGHPTMTRKAAMIRTEAHRYVFCPEDRDELYDLCADPQAMKNVAQESGYQDTRHALRERLMRWLLDSGDALPLEQDKRGWR